MAGRQHGDTAGRSVRINAQLGLAAHLRAVIVARPVQPGETHRAAVAVDAQLRQVEHAVAQGEATVGALDAQPRLAFADDRQAPYLQGFDDQRDRHVQRRQYLGPAGQLERFVRWREHELRLIHLHARDLQATAEQWPEGLLYAQVFRLDAQVVVSETQAMDIEAVGQAPVHAFPLDARTGRQQGDDARQQPIAAAVAVEYPGRHAGDQQAEDQCEQQQPAQAAPQVTRAAGEPAHRSGPMLMCRRRPFSGPSRPRARSTRTGPTGERQRRPRPTPFFASNLSV